MAVGRCAWWRGADRFPPSGKIVCDRFDFAGFPPISTYASLECRQNVWYGSCWSEPEMSNETALEFIESTAGQVAAELARRGVSPDQRVVVTVEPDDWIAEARRFSRARVAAEGLTDADIDRIIKQAQKEAEPDLE
jgi:hypothetical protein